MDGIGVVLMGAVHSGNDRVAEKVMKHCIKTRKARSVVDRPPHKRYVTCSIHVWSIVEQKVKIYGSRKP